MRGFNGGVLLLGFFGFNGKRRREERREREERVCNREE